MRWPCQSLALCASKQPRKDIQGVTFIPGNYRAKESQGGIIFLTKEKRALIVIPEPNLEDYNVWPCHSRDNTYLKVHTSKHDGTHHLTLIEEEK